MPNVKKIRDLNLPGTTWVTSAYCGRTLPSIAYIQDIYIYIYGEYYIYIYIYISYLLIFSFNMIFNILKILNISLFVWLEYSVACCVMLFGTKANSFELNMYSLYL